MAQLVEPRPPANEYDANRVTVKREAGTETPGEEAGKLVPVLSHNLLKIAVLLSSLLFFVIAIKPESDSNKFFDIVNAARYHLCPYSPIRIPLFCPQDLPYPYCTPRPSINPWQDVAKVEDAVFDRLMDEAAGGSALSSLMQEAQSVISDLAFNVQASDFTKKDQLAKEIAKLRLEAGKTGKSLQTFSKKVDRVLDKFVTDHFAAYRLPHAHFRVLTINHWALKTIERIPSYEWLLQLVIPKRQDVVTKTFGATIDILTSSLEQLIFEAERNDIRLQEVLDIMDEIRDTLGKEMGNFENKKISAKNKKSLLGAERNVNLLKDLNKQSKEGRQRIHSSLFVLRELSEELEVLRAKVAEAEVLQMLSVKEHIKSIGEGLERLKQWRIRADRMQQEKMKILLGQPVSIATPSTAT